MKLFFQNNRPAILWGLLIVVVTAVPGTAIPRLPRFTDLLHPDKLIHICMFGVFVVLLLKGFRKPGTPEWVTNRMFVIAFLTGVILAAITELYQSIPLINRTSSPWDFIANVVGCFSGLVFCMAVKK